MYSEFNSEKAFAKFKSLVKKINFANICTEFTAFPQEINGLQLQEVDDEGNLWFIIDSFLMLKNCEIEKSKNLPARIFFSNQFISQYVSIYGNIKIYNETSKIKKLWAPIVEIWNTQVDYNSNFSLLKVKPSDAYYWDDKNEKIVSFFNGKL